MDVFREKLLFFSIVVITAIVYIPDFTNGAQVVVDDDGQRIVIEKPFSRIISLYPAHTENLYYLGLERKIIGVGRADDFPPQVKSKPVFSYHDDPERFIAAGPDLVLIRPMIARGYPHLVEKLREAKIVVASLQPKGPEEMFGYWLKLGLLTGKEKEARKMVKKFRHELTKIEKCVGVIPVHQRKRVYFESIHTRMKTFAPRSIPIFALTKAGGINVASNAIRVRNTNIAQYGKERIIAKGHIIDFFLAQQGAMNRVTIEQIRKESGFMAIKAVREGKIFLLPEAIVSRPTMRLLEGIRKIAGILYPDSFCHGIKRPEAMERAFKRRGNYHVQTR